MGDEIDIALTEASMLTHSPVKDLPGNGQVPTSEANSTSRRTRIAFFDLDNTLIPTSWIMQKWRAEENKVPHTVIVKSINQTLLESGLFDALDTLLTEIRKKVDYVTIVTNAGSRTVENFYLTHTLPQLKSILRRHEVELTSTEEWVVTLGPPPSADDEDAFREFYTAVKYCEFKNRADDFAIQSASSNSNKSNQMDIISIGDQMCEISAACRLGDSFNEQIRLVKLVLILDPTNSRFTFQEPEQFLRQLNSLKQQILQVVDDEIETTVGQDVWDDLVQNEESAYVIRKDLSYWVPQTNSLTYAIGRPGRFPSEFPLYLPTEYLNLAYEQLKIGTRSMFGGIALLPSFPDDDNLSDCADTGFEETKVNRMSMEWGLGLNQLMGFGASATTHDHMGEEARRSLNSQSETISTADGQEEEQHEVFVT